MAPKKKITRTQVPGTMPYQHADWSHRLPAASTGSVTTVDAATALAEKNPAVSYFFRTSAPVDLGDKGTFAAGDMGVFTGAPWLGSAPADTYFVAQTYDLTDDATRTWIRSKVDSIKVPPPNLNAVTLQPPKSLHDSPARVGGFIFVDFPDEQGTKKISESLGRVTSYTDSKGQSRTVSDWFETESRGRCRVSFETHPDNAKGYVRVGRKLADLTALGGGGPAQLQKEVAAAVTVPASWDIVYIVLPEGAAKDGGLQSRERDCTWSTTSRETVVLDSIVFREPNDRDWTVVAHESMHAFGLDDQYTATPSGNTKFFAWTLMTCAEDAWHLLGWEKLVLGWVDLDDYVWVERGLVCVDLYEMSAADGKTKGVVVLDEDGTYAYVVEQAQPIGKTAAEHDAWSQRGLLRYRVELRSDGGHQIVPLVATWAHTSEESAAHAAPYLVADRLTVEPQLPGGMYLNVGPIVGAVPTDCVNAQVGRIADWSPRQFAATLRAEEYIESQFLPGTKDAELGRRGRITFTLEGKLAYSVCGEVQGAPVGPDTSTDNELGYFFEVKRDATLAVSQGTGPANRGKELWTKAPPQSCPDGTYFLGVVNEAQGCRFAVYSGTGPDDPNRARAYNLATVKWPVSAS